MQALVVYESMFGNTRAVAEAIAEGLADGSDGIDLEAHAVEVGAAALAPGADVSLLVVGGPTHTFGLSRPTSRQDAVRHHGGSPTSTGLGLREWLDTTPRARPTAFAAAFDTKTAKPVPGSAARGAEKRLSKLGFPLVAAAEHFHVTGVTGPLVDGELERARAWGRRLRRAYVRRAQLGAGRQ